MIALLLALSTTAAQPTLQEVLARAAEYVATFHERLSGIVAEETTVQQVTYPKHFPSSLNRKRRVQSDLLLLRPVGGMEWIQFRDVFAVDGEPVRDRQERLMRIFLTPDETTDSQTAAILSESARYNIGDVERTINTPTIALRFLEAANQRRFSFRRTGNATPGEMTREAPAPPGHFRVTTEVWTIAFAEKAKPTMIQTRDPHKREHGALKDLAAHGRFWIEPETGRVLMSELTLDATGARAAIAVNYQSEPLLGLLVPIEMRERYDRLRNRTVVDGFSTYGRFRQFQVLVDEKLGPIKK